MKDAAPRPPPMNPSTVTDPRRSWRLGSLALSKATETYASRMALSLALLPPHVSQRVPFSAVFIMNSLVKPQMKRLPFWVQGFARFASYTFK